MADKVALDIYEKEIAQAGLSDLGPPSLRSLPGIRQQFDAIDEDKRFPFDPDVARILQDANQVLNMGDVIFSGIMLFEQHIFGVALPSSRPVLVCPADAKGKIRLPRSQHFVERPLQYAPSVKPVVVVAESIHAILPRKVSLSLAYFRHAQIVKPEIRRKVWLIVPAKAGPRLRDIGPLGKSFTPPLIVVRGWIELGQIKGDEARRVQAGAFRRSLFLGGPDHCCASILRTSMVWGTMMQRT